MCGSRHRAYIHAWCERLVRCADGRNHQLVIVSLICQKAKQQHKQYTKRILPWFVIPECNIRFDLVLNLLKLEEQTPSGGRALAYAQADAVIGSASEHTAARDLRWARRLVADTLLEASELVVEMAPFTPLPGVQVGAGGLAELQRYLAALTAAGRGAYGGEVARIGWTVRRVLGGVSRWLSTRPSLSRSGGGKRGWGPGRG